ncbi:MAG: glycoside hydrolase family 25 protein [Lachnospiraceae bacterium]|nr:glycoside hydrolase family 25 protein [Lachnospiraceae bacterium]
MHDKQKSAPLKKQELDIMDEIRRLNEVTQKYSRLNMEISELEEALPQPEEAGADQSQYELEEAVRGVREKLKLVKGDVSMADMEVHGLMERLKTLRKKQQRSGWKLVAVAELVGLIVLGTVFLVYMEIGRGKSVPSNANVGQDQPGSLPAPTDGPQEPQTQLLVPDLKERAARLSKSNIAPFEASVEQVNGMEALCFTYKEMKICYANEFPVGEEPMRRIRIINGDREVIYPWDYELSGSLEPLAPEYGAYPGAAGYQLIFLQYGEGQEDRNIPGRIRMLDAARLWEYESFELENALSELFELEYSERAGENGNVSDTFMQLTVGSVSYPYRIAQGTYVDAVYYGENPLCFDRYFELTMDEEKMSFSTVVYTDGGEYLGELSGELAAVDRELVLKNVRFGAYATAYQEDAGSDGILTPRTSRMTEYITISGKNRERYYIALSDEVARVDYDMNRLVMNENGFYEYFNEKGEKISCTGIDVSKYQGDIDWKKVKEAGVEFAILRLGYRGMNEGTLELDPYYLKNVKGAAAAGVKVGVYFFSQAVSEQEAVEEAEMVLQYIKDYDVTWPVIFDTEVITSYNARANNLPRDLRTDICIAFCETIEAAGYHPMVYANTKWMIMGIDLERLTKYDKWYAYYGTSFTFPYHYDMLQYSDTGKVPGIGSAVDLDISFVDYSAK